MPIGGADLIMTFLLDRSIIRHLETGVWATADRGQQLTQRRQRLYRNHGRAQGIAGTARIGHPRGDAHQAPVGDFAEKQLSALLLFAAEDGECLPIQRMPPVVHCYRFMCIMSPTSGAS
jgi:hypothetical protein